MKFALSLSLAGLLLGGCATYNTMENVKLVSFEDDVPTAKSVGPVRGESCAFAVMGYWLGGKLTVDKALANARTQTGTSIVSAVHSDNQANLGDKTLKYMTNVSTDWDGFDAYVVSKSCLVVKGVGYK